MKNRVERGSFLLSLTMNFIQRGAVQLLILKCVEVPGQDSRATFLMKQLV